MTRTGLERKSSRRRAGWPVLLWALLAGLSLRAEPIHSNSVGGGKWSQPDTWEDKRVPVPTDVVVIASGDKVIFDRDDSTATSCASLQLDPESLLDFQSGVGRRVLRVAGPVENFGVIRMDGTLSPDDHLEIQLIGMTEGDLAVRRGGGLVISGYAQLPGGGRNVALLRVLADKSSTAGRLTAETGCSIDIKNTRVENFSSQFSRINNTGIRPNERLNLTGNQLVETSVSFEDCDTPRLTKNELSGARALHYAVMVLRTPMVEIKDNTISGYGNGIMASYSTLTLNDNTIEDTGKGIYVQASNLTVVGGAVRGSSIGIDYRFSPGSIQDVAIENCGTAILSDNSSIQVSNVTIQMPEDKMDEKDKKDEKDKFALEVINGSVIFFNSNVDPKMVKIEMGEKEAAKKFPVPVTLMQYLVVKVTGKIPPDAHVMLQTLKRSTPLAEGAVDPNIRNSPATIRPNGLTPLPRSMGALSVKSWAMKWDGSFEPSPTYRLTVFVPVPGGEGKIKESKSIEVQPNETWFRPDLDSKDPTVEVSL